MSNVAKKDSTVKTLKMNQSLVHIKHSVTIRQYKYWHLMMKFFAEKIEQGIQPDKDGFYFESRSKFAEYMGYELMTKELKADIKTLAKQEITINYLEKDGKQAVHGMHFVSEYKITSNQIGFVLPSFIRNVILGDDESKRLFLLLNWDIFNSFAGKYEAILYKLCKDYIGVGRTPYFTIDEYREYIGLNDSEYKATDNLTRRCIKNPLQAINESDIVDISVQVEFKKQGRSVVGLHFTMQHKKQAVLPFEEFKPSTAFSQAKIGISPEMQIKYLETHSEDLIQATIERANEYIEQLRSNGKKVNAGAIYNKAFNDKWGEQRLEEKRLKQEEEEKRQKKLDWQKQKAEKAKQEKAEKAKQEEQAKIDLINEFDNLSNQEQIEIIESMLDKNKQFKPVFDMLNTPYLEHGISAYKHSSHFKSLLLTELKEKNNQDYEQKLIIDFENLSNQEKTKQINFMLHVNSSNKKLSDLLEQAYQEHGTDAHRHNSQVHKQLVEHLHMSKFTASLANDTE